MMVEICGRDFSFLPSRSSIDRANRADKIEMENTRQEQIKTLAKSTEKFQLNFDLL